MIREQMSDAELPAPMPATVKRCLPCTTGEGLPLRTVVGRLCSTQ